MKKYFALFLLLFMLASGMILCAQNEADTLRIDHTPLLSAKRLSVGGYGEAVYKYSFHSDNPFRYSSAKKYEDAKGHGRVDIPHAVIMLNYDFGKGWSFGSEIEFEHGGTESAVELEAEESGEFEKEIERGGEVALEQFWIQKSFSNVINIRAGHLVVPVGATNNAHEPNNFFGVYRPEGENTIFPCTWHETGIEVWGRWRGWKYSVMAIPALNSSYFNEDGWVHDGSASPYEFRVANNLAVAARIDNYTFRGLRLSLSGYAGNSFNNDIRTNTASKYENTKGLVLIGSFDFSYQMMGFVFRGNADYGHLGDADVIAVYNKSLSHSTSSPYPLSIMGEEGYAVGFEMGYDIFRLFRGRVGGRQLTLFARYDNYDSYIPAGIRSDIAWCKRECISAGINYRPLPQIIIKAEGGIRILPQQYNNEPWFAMGITWAGMFN
ncbi:MAG: hypothetical protein IJ764_00725 [Bacteroidales bacterium]|nr:hypothetical protein [Bacteroidales bacterium]